MQKISKVSKDLNIGIATALECLHKHDIAIDNDPNARISEEAVMLLNAEFCNDKLMKSKADECRSILYASEISNVNAIDVPATGMPEDSQLAKDDKFKQLIIECYEVLPSLPGWYRKMDDLQKSVNEKLSVMGMKADDLKLKSTLGSMGAKIEPEYESKNTGEKFEAVRIIKSEPISVLGNDDKTEIREIVLDAIRESGLKADKEGWYHFVKLAPILRKKGITKEKYGDKKLLPLIEEALGKSMETNVQGTEAYARFRFDNDDNGENKRNHSFGSVRYKTANMACNTSHSIKSYEVRNAYRDMVKGPDVQDGWIKVTDLQNKVGWNGTVSDFVKTYGLKYNKRENKVRISNISRFEILDDVYFDPKRNPYPKNILILKGLTLEEPWGDDGKFRLLDNYLRYTYARVKELNKIALSEDGLYGCWNTGLVDKRYLPIYCFMTRRNPMERWVFQGFCIDGEDLGKTMTSKISDPPERAEYFTDGNLLFEADSNKLSVDYDHIITEHPSRLPEEWVKRALSGDATDKLENEMVSQYDERVGELISKDRDALTFLQTLLKQAIDISIMRCQWNYKTAIPYYDPNSKNIGWFLPLCIRSKNGRLEPFAALVVTKKSSGRYQGETIYRLNWAYSCARLVCRPDSDWLSPSRTDDGDDE